MYLEHYGLDEAPFSITPDPRFVFLSERHRDALAHLLFGIGQGGGGGFVQLTGEVGTGKTTLSRLLLEQIPENTRVALVLNPRLTPVELLETICEELHIEVDAAGGESLRGSTKGLVDALNRYLLDAYAQGLRVVLVIDEAQNLSVEALEQVRLLTNLETDTQKLLQIILLGQPELRDKLARGDLRQLAQRITARFHLTPLDATETSEYLRHRYRVAGGQRFPFDETALRRMHVRSDGVPRLLNVIAERALLAGYARDAVSIDERLVDQAANEALPAPVANRQPPWPWIAAAAGALALVGLIGLWQKPERIPAPAAIANDTAASARTTSSPIVATSTTTRIDATQFAQSLALVPASSQAAWQRLLSLWKLPVSAITVNDDGSCSAAASGVHCAMRSGSLDRLLALDRPALLRLRNGTAPAWALLLGADARHARLSLASGNVDVDRATLQSAWDGRYAILWQAPVDLPETMSPGNTGPAVRWLRGRLDLPAAADPVYDADTAQAVRAFQQARGLPADGVAGAETLVALADGGGPRLQRTLD